MSSLNTAIIAPLVRGLFLNATGKPIVVAPAAPAARGTSAAPAEALVSAVASKAPLVLALSAASLGEGGELDEAAAAAELRHLFAAAAAPSLPAIVEVSLGAERLRLEVRDSAVVAELAAPSGALAKAVPSGALAKAAPSGAPNSAAGRSAVVAGKIALVTAEPRASAPKSRAASPPRAPLSLSPTSTWPGRPPSPKP